MNIELPVCAGLRREWGVRRQLNAEREGPSYAGGVLADEPEMGALVQGGAVGFEVVAGRESGAGLFEQGSVLRQGEGFDGDEGLEEWRAETVGGFEQGRPGGAVLVEVEVGVEESGGGRGQAVLVTFEQWGHGTAANLAEVARVREEL